jgi:hypothetical protein
MFNIILIKRKYVAKIFFVCGEYTGPRGSIVVNALCYKPEGLRFETR